MPRKQARAKKDKGTAAFNYLKKLRAFLNTYRWGVTPRRKGGETGGPKPPPKGP